MSISGEYQGMNDDDSHGLERASFSDTDSEVKSPENCSEFQEQNDNWNLLSDAFDDQPQDELSALLRDCSTIGSYADKDDFMIPSISSFLPDRECMDMPVHEGRKKKKKKKKKLQRINKATLRSLIERYISENVILKAELDDRRHLCKALEKYIQDSKKQVSKSFITVSNLKIATKLYQMEVTQSAPNLFITPKREKRHVGVQATPSLIDNVMRVTNLKGNKTNPLWRIIYPTKSEESGKLSASRIRNSKFKSQQRHDDHGNNEQVADNAAETNSSSSSITKSQKGSCNNVKRRAAENINSDIAHKNMESHSKEACTNTPQQNAAVQIDINEPASGETYQEVAAVGDTSCGTNQNATALTRIRDDSLNSQTDLHPVPPLPNDSEGSSVIVIAKTPPTQPQVKLTFADDRSGIIVSWNHFWSSDDAEAVSHYEICYYKERSEVSSFKWKSIGSVEALSLPMAVRLGQFQRGFIYHFAVRAIDVFSRKGPFSIPKCIRF